MVRANICDPGFPSNDEATLAVNMEGAYDLLVFEDINAPPTIRNCGIRRLGVLQHNAIFFFYLTAADSA